MYLIRNRYFLSISNENVFGLLFINCLTTGVSVNQIMILKLI